MPPYFLVPAARLPSLLPSVPSSLGPSLAHVRRVKYQAYDAWLDQDEIDEAHKWFASFTQDSLPKAHNTYSRMQGHMAAVLESSVMMMLTRTRTETKATSVWPLSELCKGLPKLMRSPMRSSRYYIKRSDSIMIHSQTHRSKTANTDENCKKLYNEMCKIYREQIPAPTSETKRKKHEAAEKAFNQNRLKVKKQLSLKKASRKGGE
ncbi:hypothetical protein RRF57_000932 [Xylaria bambusicola]|uniref:Prokaryotic-type class I peptide chain release factors domain-containing protein n=1 Tax=Xylaria bambusicola TaxID=326684 RepID=A0AAN7UGL8_9PEZI